MSDSWLPVSATLPPSSTIILSAFFTVLSRCPVRNDCTRLWSPMRCAIGKVLLGKSIHPCQTDINRATAPS